MTRPSGTDDHRKRLRLKWLRRRWPRHRGRGGPLAELTMPISHKDLWVKIKRESKGKSPAEELRLLESYLSDWPEYKGPYQELRKKLERRVDELRRVGRVLASHGWSSDPFSVRKRGLAEVALAGLPNVGKTTVFNALTGATAEAADYPYTTLTPNVGMFSLGAVEFEIVDLPPFPEGSLDELHYAGGLKEAVLNATLLCYVLDATADPELQADALEGHLKSMGADGGPDLVALTRCDLPRGGAARSAAAAGVRAVPEFRFPLAEGGRRRMAEALCAMAGRFVVDARDPASPEEPMAYALQEGATVTDLAVAIHNDLAKRALKARVWGPSASFDGQEVGMDHRLAGGDTVEILTR